MATDDRRRPRRPSAAPTFNSLTAAAALVDAPNIQRLPATAEWANEGWHYYDTVPEVRFATTYLSNALSRCRLVAARMGAPGDEPEVLDAGVAADLMAQFGGGPGGQSQLLAAAAPQLTVPGIGYMVGEPPADREFVPGRPMDEQITDPDTWRVLSADELEARGGRYYVIEGEGTNAKRQLPLGTLVVKFWRQHHRWHYQPDSPIRSCLPVLRELELLSQHVDATAVSRLAGAGILLLPSEVTFPVDPRYADEADPFTASMINTMSTAIRDRDSAAALCPIVVRVPAEYVDRIKHLTFDTPLNGVAQDLRTEALRRFAAGIDLPAEVILGLADSNHWTAWQIEESALKLHIEPALEALCHAITVGFLSPGLKAMNAYEPDIVCWYDASELTVRPDRSADAKDLYDRHALSVTALRRETGFDDSDAPSDDELRQMLLMEAAAAQPQLLPMLGPLMGLGNLEAPEGIDPYPSSGSPAPGEAPPVPGDESQPLALPSRAAIPDSAPPVVITASSTEEAVAEAAAIAGLTAAADAMVLRALSVAGRRLQNHARKAGLHLDGSQPETFHTCAPEDLRTASLDALMADAWDRVPEVAARYGVDPASLRLTLDAYTRGLVTSGWPHEFQALADVLGA